MRSITPSFLRSMPLPVAGDDADKKSRGVALIVGGSVTVPGAVLLAGVAALRAGAGILQLAAPHEISVALGLAVPEALVVGLRSASRASVIGRYARGADALAIGPGMMANAATTAFARACGRMAGEDATVILDAAAIAASGIRRKCVITPHAGEMATLTGLDSEDVARNAPDVALDAAAKFGCVVALKGATTYIAAEGACYRYDGGSVGLATSGSGDTLAGIIAGLAARGADPLTATLWAVWAHGTAGRQLGRRVGRTGFLARELLSELPRLLN